MNEKKLHLATVHQAKRQQSLGVASGAGYLEPKSPFVNKNPRSTMRNSYLQGNNRKRTLEQSQFDIASLSNNSTLEGHNQTPTRKQVTSGKKVKMNWNSAIAGPSSNPRGGHFQQNQQHPPNGSNLPANVQSLKSARRYQLMNPQNQAQPRELGYNCQQFSPHNQTINISLINQFHSPSQHVQQLGPSHQTINNTQYIKGNPQQRMQPKSSINGERSSLPKAADYILQSPTSSDTNSSIATLDQSMRIRIGGHLPRALHSGSNGVPLNHFYQTQSLSREGQQNTNTNTKKSNSNSVQNTQRDCQTRVDNDSSISAKSNVNHSQNVALTKRNNFLSASRADDQKKDLSSYSHQNPPTIRNIGLNQRILQKNLVRINKNKREQPQKNQTIDNFQGIPSNVPFIPAKNITLRHKKYSQPRNNSTRLTNGSTLINQQNNGHRHQQLSTLQESSNLSSLNNSQQLQQTLQKIFSNKRKESTIISHNDNSSILEGEQSNTAPKHPLKVKRKNNQNLDHSNTQKVNIAALSLKGTIPKLNFSSASQEDQQTLSQKQKASARRHHTLNPQRAHGNNQDQKNNQQQIQLSQRSNKQGQAQEAEYCQQQETALKQMPVEAIAVQRQINNLQIHQELQPQQIIREPKQPEDIHFPISPGKALQYLASHLTSYEKSEILDYPQIYYLGMGTQKIQGAKTGEANHGYDDKKGNYKIIKRDHIGYRYEVQKFLGKGSFGIAVKCFDHKKKEEVAIKVIKNKKKYYYQAGVELKILQYLKDHDPDDTMNIIHMKGYVIFRKHLCISFELMSINLYEFLKLNDFEGLSLGLVRRFSIQLLYALKFLKEQDIIHCDLKPENILLKDPTKSGIKIIDFGSSCFQDERVYTYIQSRFYRAPEIILGIPYTSSIDVWSFGCMMAEFCIGYPIFPGENETEQLAMIMEVCGIPPPEVLHVSQRKSKFFTDDNIPLLVKSESGSIRKPGAKIIEEILQCEDESFVNFIERCLDWNPETRMTPDQALRHPWILEGLPPKVLIHHQKLHSIPTSDLPPHIKEMRKQYIASEGARSGQQQYSSEPRRQSIRPNQTNQRNNQQKVQSHDYKQHRQINSHQITSNPTKTVTGPTIDVQNNFISPRAQKLMSISQENRRGLNKINFKQSNSFGIDNQQLEHTLRNRKIIITTSSKKDSAAQGAGSIGGQAPSSIPVKQGAQTEAALPDDRCNKQNTM